MWVVHFCIFLRVSHVQQGNRVCLCVLDHRRCFKFWKLQVLRDVYYLLRSGPPIQSGDSSAFLHQGRGLSRRCMGDAWEMLGRCLGDAWEMLGSLLSSFKERCDVSAAIAQAFQTEITFCTKLWLVCTEILVIALGGTMVAFSGFHLFLSSKGMTTIEFLTRPQFLTATVEPGSCMSYM